MGMWKIVTNSVPPHGHDRHVGACAQFILLQILPHHRLVMAATAACGDWPPSLLQGNGSTPMWSIWKNWLVFHGALTSFSSDCGYLFLAELLREVLTACSIMHVPTSSYHPRTHGLTEHFNHMLATMLSHCVCAEHSNWDCTVIRHLHLQHCRALCNSFPSICLVCGCNPSSRLDTVLPCIADVGDNPVLAAAISLEQRNVAKWPTTGHLTFEASSLVLHLQWYSKSCDDRTHCPVTYERSAL